MFALSADDLTSTMLGCGDGPASFNVEATRLGSRVVSCDPLYRFSTTEIRRRITETYDEVIEQTRRNAHEFIWNDITSVDDLGRVRMSAMNAFLDDYDRGKAEGRYLDAALPSLPFADIRSISPCARISCFCTPNSSASRFTTTPSRSCVAWRPRSAFFRCWNSVADALHSSSRLSTRYGGAGSLPVLIVCVTNFGAAQTRR
jgi:hypothetical protein